MRSHVTLQGTDNLTVYYGSGVVGAAFRNLLHATVETLFPPRPHPPPTLPISICWQSNICTDVCVCVYACVCLPLITTHAACKLSWLSCLLCFETGNRWSEWVSMYVCVVTETHTFTHHTHTYYIYPSHHTHTHTLTHALTTPTQMAEIVIRIGELFRVTHTDTHTSKPKHSGSVRHVTHPATQINTNPP